MSCHESKDLPTFIAPEHFGTLAHEKVIDAHIASGQLPYDTYFRLRAVGVNELDWQQPDRRLLFFIANDIAANTVEPERLRVDTQRLLWGERPDAIIDWDQSAHKQAYTKFGVMYYRLMNLAAAIKRMRTDNDETVRELPVNGSYYSLDEYEDTRCYRLAHPIWRVIIARTRPEWLERPQQFCPPTFSFNSVYHPGDRLARRRVVGAAVLSDTIVHDIYDESVRTGVRGIGPNGRESLRYLLLDEHSELFEP